MTWFKSILSRQSVIKKYRYKLVLFIGLTWTVIDSIYMFFKYYVFGGTASFMFFEYRKPSVLILREVLVLIMSWCMAYILVFRQKKIYGNMPLWLSFLINTILLLLISFAFNMLLHFTYSVFISQLSIAQAFHDFVHDAFYTEWLLSKFPHWILIFLLTQLIIELSEKYSPGVFKDIFIGKYIHPREEVRIVLFIDLKDSTPIAEKLGNKLYFRFIRDFIYYISISLIEFNGRIYQYVGDEVVASWLLTYENTKKCLDSLKEIKRALNRRSNLFKLKYSVVPEFRAGIHVGPVTVGEIGVIKKDLAMSGDTMNTTARIRTAASEFNQQFLISKEFRDVANHSDWQTEYLGKAELKGKKEEVELYALKI